MSSPRTNSEELGLSSGDGARPGSELPAAQVPSREDLEAKYGHLGREELIAACRTLQPLHRAELDRLVEERWAAGVYDVHVLAEGETIPPPRDVDGSIPSYGFKTQPIPGGVIVKVAALRADEHPEFSALDAEYKWLRGRIGPGGMKGN